MRRQLSSIGTRNLTGVSISNNLRRAVLVACAAVPLALAQTSDAATYYWDPTFTASNAGGGTGTWNQANVNWYDGSGDVAWGAATTNSAVFGGTAGTVTLAATVPAGVAGLQFDTTGYIITGAATLNLNGGDINVTTGTAQIGSTTATIIAQGATTVNKTGSGTLTIGGTGNNTASAGSVFNINNGTVAITKGGIGIAATNVNVNNGTVLDTSGSTAGSPISGTLNFAGSGSWTRHATAANTMVNIGSLTGQTIGGAGLLTFSAGGTTTVSGTNVFTTDINTSPGSSRSHTWTLGSASDSLTFSGIYAGSGSNSILTFSGPTGAIVTLSGSSANTYAGDAVVTGVTLKLNKSSSVLALRNNTTFTVNGGGTIQEIGFGGQIPVGNNWVVGNAAKPGGTLDLDTFNETAFTVAMNQGTIKAGKVTLSSTGTVAGVVAVGPNNLINSDLDLNSYDVANKYRRFNLAAATDVLEVRGSVSDSRQGNFTTANNPLSFDLSGNGKLILSGVNTYAGQTKITNAGVLSINSDSALGAVPASPTPSSLQFAANGTLQATETFTLNANRGLAVNTAILDVAATKTMSYGGVLAETTGSGGTVKKTGTGELAITGSSNIYAGATTISGGALSVTSLVNGDGALVLSTTTAGSAIVTMASTAGLTAGMQVSAAGSGKIPVGLTIASVDSPTQITLSSGTGVTAGTALGAVYGTASSLGYAPVADASKLALDGGSLKYVGSSAGTTNRAYTLNATGGGFDASGTTVAATMTVSADMTGPATGTPTFTLSGSNTGANAISGKIVDGGGTVSLNKAGGGQWILSGSNTYTGTTTISEGTLAIGASDRIADASALSLAGGTLSTGGFNETMASLGLSQSSSIDFGAGASVLNFASLGAFDTSKSLSLLGWSGSAAGNGTDQLFIGTTLSTEQLAAIHFVDPAGYTGTYAAQQLAGGEVVVVVPEPAVLGMLAMGGLSSLLMRRRRA